MNEDNPATSVSEAVEDNHDGMWLSKKFLMSSSSDVVDPFIAEREKLSVMSRPSSWLHPSHGELSSKYPIVGVDALQLPRVSQSMWYRDTELLRSHQNSTHSGINSEGEWKTILNGVDVPSVEHGLSDMSLAGIINSIVTRIYSSCRTWLHLANINELDEEEKHRVDSVRRTLRAWFTNAMCSCDVLSSSWPLIGLRFLFGRQGAGLEKIGARRFIMTLLWSAKWSVGATALLCIQIYGKDYTDFVIKGEEANLNMAESTAELFGSLQGWELWAYFMAFQLSMEGTIKKVRVEYIILCFWLSLLNLSKSPFDAPWRGWCVR